MRIRSAIVYQPAVPLRGVSVWLKDDGTHATEDFEVIGVQMEHRVYDQDTDSPSDEIHHEVLVWGDGIQTVSDFHRDTENRLIVAPASWPAEYWEREIDREANRLRKTLEARRAGDVRGLTAARSWPASVRAPVPPTVGRT